MAELRSTSPDPTPSYFDSSRADLSSSLEGMQRSHPTTSSASLTLVDAMQWVINGKLSGDALYQQLPLPLKALMDQKTNERYGASFSQVGSTKQNEIFRELLELTGQSTSSYAPSSSSASTGSQSHSASGSQKSAVSSSPGRHDRHGHPGIRRAMISGIVIGSGLLLAGAWYSLSPVVMPSVVMPTADQVESPPSAIASELSTPAQEDKLADASDSGAVALQDLTDPPMDSFSGISAVPQRTWTDIGQRQVLASLIRYEDGKVELRTDQGHVASISLEDLSQKDRSFLWKLAESQSSEIELFEPRLWTAAKDSSVVEAAAIGVDAETVHLLRQDGRIFTVPRSTFCQTDQSYLQSLTQGH